MPSRLNGDSFVDGLRIYDTPFDPDSDEKVIYVRQPKDQKPLYKIYLYVDGSELNYVDSVTYKLHPTFPRPVHKVERTVTNPKCEFVIWTWGIFTVQATVKDKRGATYEIDHYLTYSRFLQEPGVKFQRM